MAEALEVHRQERSVGEHVPVAQSVVELEAVEDPRTVLEAEDVLGLEVAVTVARPPLGDSCVEEWSSSGQVATGQLGHPGDVGRVDGAISERLHLGDAGLPERRDGGGA